MINVVGIGPGNPELVTDEVKKIISSSEVVVGGRRNIESLEFLINKDAKIYYINAKLDEMSSFIEEEYRKNMKICVIASGNPSLYGIARYMVEKFSANKVEIHPGISSIQYLFSKAKINMNDCFITSSHGRMPDMDVISCIEKVAMVTDRKFPVSRIAQELIKRNSDRKVVVGERLSYKDEKITFMTLEEAKNYDADILSCVILYRDIQDKSE